MELKALAMAVRDDCTRGVMLDGLSSEEAAAFEAYVDEYELSDLQEKIDKFI